MVGMRWVGQGIQDFLVAREAAGVFKRAAPGAVSQVGRRDVVVCGGARYQFEPVQPAVTEVVFVERFSRPQGEQLIEEAPLLRPVARFFTLLPRKPLRDLRGTRRRPAAAERTDRRALNVGTTSQSTGPR